MKWYQQTDVMLGVGVIAIVAMLVIPIPTFLLDTLLSFSVMIGLVALLTAMYNRESSDFSVFPTLLLVTTVFRLALNVSSTRLILLQGPRFDGQLIRAFGDFVIQGNYLIGFIIFIILILVQMMVITKGATRIGEVAARFTLDALPGKQMSIDSDLSAGIISEEEARDRRESLRKEVDFYGQMDGATKFVQGDVRVGLIITAINIIGGLIVGMSLREESFKSALETYSLLTIGDGLVAQIPSLLITTATGMVVTRAGATQNLSTDLTTQLFKNTRILWLVTGTLGFSSLLPGFPMFPLLSIAGFMGFLAYQTGLLQEKQATELREKEKMAKSETSTGNERFIDEINVDPLKLEIGYNLVSLVDRSQGGSLLERITNLRQKFARDMGMIVPPIRINDNMDLDGNEYAILVGGIEVSRAKVYPEKLVALDSGNVRTPMEGDSYQDPTYNLNGILIPPDKKSEAEVAGYLIVDATNILITQLSETLRNYATQVMGREEIKMLIDKMKTRFPAVVEDATKVADTGLLQSILHNLLKEGVSVRNMTQILETLADYAGNIKDPVMLTELVRQRLGRQIVSEYLDDSKRLKIKQVDPAIENELRTAISFDEREGRIFSLDPHLQVRIRDAFIKSYNEANQSGSRSVFLTSSEVRMGIFMLLERELNSRNFAVLAFEELPPDVKIEVIGQVILEEEKDNAVR